MDQETIRAIADQVANQTILTSWKVWSLQFALWIVGTALAAFAGAFFAKRGEHKAIQADFQSLKNQLKENTIAVKMIETEIGHSDWAAREWKTLRRIKLEELLSLNEELLQWVYESVSAAKETGVIPSLFKAHTLGLLYFPELQLTINQLLEDTLSFQLECGNYARSSSQPEQKRKEIRDRAAALSNKVMIDIRSIGEQAQVLIATIVGIDKFTFEPKVDSSPTATQ